MQIKPLEIVDIVISIYNQEKIIEEVLRGVFKCTTTPFNLILVFDGCTDKTQDIAVRYIENHKSLFLRKLKITTAENVFETKANNIGFKLGTEDYLLTLQDDMVIKEKGWEKRITFPLRKYDDVFAVTGRAAMNICIKDTSDHPIYSDMAGREYFTLKRNTFSIRAGINRGPVAFRADVLRKLNFLDEQFAPAQFDEFDLVLRAFELYGFKSGVFAIDYRSDASWGKTRQSESSMNTSSTFKKNVVLLREKHNQLKEVNGITEDRLIFDSEVDYTEREMLLKRIVVRISTDFRHALVYFGRKKALVVHKTKIYILMFLGKRDKYPL
jgi:glycosyltransferase involved in cell wall biosynthesis